MGVAGAALVAVPLSIEGVPPDGYLAVDRVDLAAGSGPRLRTHGGRIRERSNCERSSRKQKEGLSAPSPRAFNAPLEDAENQLPAGPAGSAT